MKTQPLALNALLCVGALLAPAFLASCREAPERQAQIRFGLFPNVTHVQGLVARHFSRTGEGWFEKRIFERTGKNISILWYAYNAGPGAMEAMFANSLDFTYVGPGPAINAYSKSNGTLLQIVAGAVQRGSGLVVPTHSGACTQKTFKGNHRYPPIGQYSGYSLPDMVGPGRRNSHSNRRRRKHTSYPQPRTDTPLASRQTGRLLDCRTMD